MPRGGGCGGGTGESLGEAAGSDGGCHIVTDLVLHLQLIQPPALADTSLEDGEGGLGCFEGSEYTG